MSFENAPNISPQEENAKEAVAKFREGMESDPYMEQIIGVTKATVEAVLVRMISGELDKEKALEFLQNTAERAVTDIESAKK
jgi:hypothetical protein